MSQVKELIEKIDNELMKQQYENTKDVMDIVGKFIKQKQLLLYGGFAINLLLPKKNKFYKQYTINDYDCFSNNAKAVAKELAELLQKKGYQYIKVRKALHDSTFKVFVDFIAVLDITQISEESYIKFKKISTKEQKTKLYKYYKEDYLLAPFSFLMSNMHYELARPLSSYYRWDKIYRRQSVFANLSAKQSIKNTTLKSDKNHQSADKYVLQKLLQYIEKNKHVIVNEYALKYHGYTNIQREFASNEISIYSVKMEKTKKDFDKYVKQHFEKYKIITEQHNSSSALMYDSYKITIANKETEQRFVLNIIDASQDCLSVMNKNKMIVGSLNTVIYFMYRKYLLQEMNGNPDQKLWDNIQYLECNIQEKMKANPKYILSTTCYGVNQSFKEMLASKWRKKQTLMYL